MHISGLDTQLAAAQLKQLFGIEEIFLRRGRRVASYEAASDLLFTLQPYVTPQAQFEAMVSASFRRIVHFVSSHNGPCTVDQILAALSDLPQSKVRDKLEQAIGVGMLARDGAVYRPSRTVGFGPTFEWYVAATCSEALASIAYWGVHVEALDGDYDVVVVRNADVGYIECKCGNVGNITRDEVASYLRRERLLAPQFSVYLVDGASLDRMDRLVTYALEQSGEYALKIPGVMETEVTLSAERYREFVRLVPINAFFVGGQRPLPRILRQVYEFLTLVCDRHVRAENKAAKSLFL